MKHNGTASEKREEDRSPYPGPGSIAVEAPDEGINFDEEPQIPTLKVTRRTLCEAFRLAPVVSKASSTKFTTGFRET